MFAEAVRSTARNSEARFDYHLVKPAVVEILQSIPSMKNLRASADATRH